jgi:hypothetical protein
MGKLGNIVALGAAGYAISKLFGSGATGGTAVSWAGTQIEDKRAKLTVPYDYCNLDLLTSGPRNELFNNGGIVFPYTPSISFERSATWTPQSLIHSNYNFYAYKNSAVTSIKLSAKFTVQNDTDAGIYLSTMLLLNALTKMPFGTDTNAGSPPPICRLSAYGGFVLDNVPVAVASFQTELTPDVDYYITSPMLDGTTGSYDYFNQGSNMVPTVSTITLSLIPVYSRYEQMTFSVDDLLKGNLANQGQTPGKGYL